MATVFRRRRRRAAQPFPVSGEVAAHHGLSGGEEGTRMLDLPHAAGHRLLHARLDRHELRATVDDDHIVPGGTADEAAWVAGRG